METRRMKQRKVKKRLNQDDRWITIGREGKDGEKHGQHVYIDDDGVISKGPKGLVGKSLEELSNKTKATATPKETAAEAPKPEAIEPSHKLRDKYPLTPEEQKKFDEVDASGIVYQDPESIELYKLLKIGKYFKRKDLRKLSVVRNLEKEAKKWEKKVGDAVNETSDERKKIRDQIFDDFMKQGAYSGTAKGEDGREHDVFDGKINKGHEAWIIIGWPASGKSTRLVNPLSKEKGAFILDSDMLKERYPEFKESKGAAASAVTPDSNALRRKAFNEFTKGRRKGENLIIPILGREKDAVDSFLNDLERAGYNVHVRYQKASRREAANRMIMRALGMGRIVPLRTINKEGGDPEDVFKSYKGKTNLKGDKYVEE